MALNNLKWHQEARVVNDSGGPMTEGSPTLSLKHLAFLPYVHEKNVGFFVCELMFIFV